MSYTDAKLKNVGREASTHSSKPSPCGHSSVPSGLDCFFFSVMKCSSGRLAYWMVMMLPWKYQSTNKNEFTQVTTQYVKDMSDKLVCEWTQTSRAGASPACINPLTSYVQYLVEHTVTCVCYAWCTRGTAAYSETHKPFVLERSISTQACTEVF